MNCSQMFLSDEAATEQLGYKLAKQLSAPLVVYLYGDLGAGKTTLVRGFLKGLGHQGSTKSPTYTLVEPYRLAEIDCFHFDLYRLADPEELEFIGIREYQTEKSILLFEWPDQGTGMIPPADLILKLEYQDAARQIEIQDISAKLPNDWNLNNNLCQNGDK
ncbi:MAG: tRNA (adenosine(37)-N6)-threonylcarbamoyltransferase complex ATPase subunit type 1 TsaE [Gammaproteobacteria bacterium]|nr:tRNA (adenosine(37)-N6)-threonylcarbamoyltransferase complex ATPase subunit type 1 TsaE [Gammaproteobacteria bacterium]